MNPLYILLTLVGYFLLLAFVGYLSSRGSSDNQTFFKANKSSPWYLVAFGMIGASLSGVTFISVPGWVASTNMSYMQTVLGYVLGYWVIWTILLPVYYRMNLTSIYVYLQKRLGEKSYLMGAVFFLISRIIGASFRLYLVAEVLYILVFQPLGVPYVVAIILVVFTVWLYTQRGGIKTVVWTDTLQTSFMLIALGTTLVVLYQQLGLSSVGIVDYVEQHRFSQMFFWEDWAGKNHFFKNFLSGAFITIAMTGLDQDMMQKNLTISTLKEAKKNMQWFSVILVVVNVLFLILGLMLYDYIELHQLDIAKSDDAFVQVVNQPSMPTFVMYFFVIGLIAAAYSSADSALTSMTTSFSIDILRIGQKPLVQQERDRKRVHIALAGALVLVIIVFKYINSESVISQLFKVAGFTYGPLLGLFAFGLFTKRQVKDRYVPWVVVISPLICVALYYLVPIYLGYNFSFELLIVNGLLTFGGLYYIRQNINE